MRPPSTIQKHSVGLTSVSLEHAFWDRLQALARSRGIAMQALLHELKASKPPFSGLSSHIRVTLLELADSPQSAEPAKSAEPRGYLWNGEPVL
jgi:predicted DNA-binding ribbon-helix-helix protein